MTTIDDALAALLAERDAVTERLDTIARAIDALRPLTPDVSRLTAERDRLRSELAACRREITKAQEHLNEVYRDPKATAADRAEARDALLRRDEPCCDDRRIYDGGAYFEPYCVNCGRPA